MTLAQPTTTHAAPRGVDRRAVDCGSRGPQNKCDCVTWGASS